MPTTPHHATVTSSPPVALVLTTGGTTCAPLLLDVCHRSPSISFESPTGGSPGFELATSPKPEIPKFRFNSSLSLSDVNARLTPSRYVTISQLSHPDQPASEHQGLSESISFRLPLPNLPQKFIHLSWSLSHQLLNVRAQIHLRLPSHDYVPQHFKPMHWQTC